MHLERPETGPGRAQTPEADPEITSIAEGAVKYAEDVARSEDATRWTPDVAINHAVQFKEGLSEEKWHQVKDAILKAPKKVTTLKSFTSKRRRH